MRRRIDRPFPRFSFRIHRSTFIGCILAFLFSLSIGVSFGNAQEEPKPKLQEWQINGILAALDDGYSGVKQTAFRKLVEFDAEDLKAFPKQSEEIGKRAIALLNNSKEDSYALISAAEALRKLGKTNDTTVQALTKILENSKENSYTRTGAAEVLRKLGKTSNTAVQVLTEIVENSKEDSFPRISAAETLGNLSKTGDTAIQVLTEILKNSREKPYHRDSAAQALGNLSKISDTNTLVLTEILKNSKEDSSVRISVAEALRKLGETNDTATQVLTEILKNGKEESYTRISAAEALRKLGETNDAATQVLTEILKNSKEKSYTRINAAEALRKLGETNDTATQVLTEILKNSKEESYTRVSAAETLGDLKQLVLNEVFVFIDGTHDRHSGSFDNSRFSAYFYGRGENDIKALLKWIGLPEYKSIPTQLTHAEGRKTLEVFVKAWEPSREFPESRVELARGIADVAKMVQWQTSDIPFLEQHYKNLSNAQFSSVDSVKAAIDSLTFWKQINQFRNLIAAHLTFWIALIFAYPKFPQVQAIFFWNPWVRRILGVGYVGFLLAWVPFLRRKLFEPFKFSLLADARLTHFDPTAYFPQSNIILVGSRQIIPLNTALPAIQGQTILEGSSGLGKSMFLRHLVQRSDRIVVFLPARKCENGVIEAIQAKLHGQAQDAEFLKNLIYSGAIDICIDGLNEVTADTRAKISQFVESYFKGNIILTTQPIEWIAPSTAKIYELQPLQTDQIETFLLSRQAIVAPNSISTYADSCRSYLAQALNPHQSSEELAATQRILSNPMDLTVVAQMIALGKKPDLFRLQEQQYQLMAADYRDRWNQDFPMRKFAEALYQLRLNDEKAIPSNEFLQELTSMEDEQYKMVVSRQWKDAKGEPQREWYCRHDKIMEFFIVQTFLGDRNLAQNRLIDHMGDPRFRGVYFLLATLLSLNEAADLREKLIFYAANTKDHTVSDTFVQLFHSRATLNAEAASLT